MTADRRPLSIGGYDVLLTARRPSDRVLLCYADRYGRPTDRYREAMPHELRGIGWGIASIKAVAASLPLLLWPWETPPVEREAPATRDILHAHHAIAQGDR